MAGPCSWTIDTGCCSDFWGTLSPAEQAAASSAASFIVWAATGRRYGLCPITVRPCGRYPCDNGIGGWYWVNGTWTPYVIGGQWFNCTCGLVCTCGARCKIYLPGPVSSIASVTLDGVLVDPSTYRVDDGRFLARVGEGNCWPSHQDFQENSGTGTLLVSYVRGETPPAYLLAAAGTYACEWAKMCRGMDCLIPSRVVTLTRQGTTFQMVDIDTLLSKGLTGVSSVDQVIALANPTGLTHRMSVLTPDLPGPVMTTWP